MHTDSTIRVIIADDNKDLLSATTTLLAIVLGLRYKQSKNTSSPPFIIEAMHEGGAVLNRISELSDSELSKTIVILDNDMSPGLSGQQVLTELKTSKNNSVRNMHTILTTGDSNVLEDFHEGDRQHYLMKPVTYEVFTAILNDCLDQIENVIQDEESQLKTRQALGDEKKRKAAQRDNGNQVFAKHARQQLQAPRLANHLDDDGSYMKWLKGLQRQIDRNPSNNQNSR